MIEISVVIPTYNNISVLKKTLLAFDAQNFDFNLFEVIVVNDGSSDNTLDLLKKLSRQLKIHLRIITQINSGPAKARNKGILAARGKTIIIVNDDVVPSSDLIKRHTDFHRLNSKKNIGLLGYVTWHNDLKVTPFMKWLEDGGPYFSFSKIKGKIAGWERFWTCNISAKKIFLVENNLFDENFPYAAWEDVEFGARLGTAGLKLFYDKKAIGYHYHPTSVEKIKKKMIANGESVMLLKNKINEDFLPPLAKRPYLAIILDNYLLNPFVFLIEYICKFFEDKIVIHPLYTLLLLHYRIVGLKKWWKSNR